MKETNNEEKLKEDLKKFLSNKLNNREYYIVLAFRKEEDSDTPGVHVHCFSETNMNTSSTPFDVFKLVITSLWDMTSKMTQNIMGPNLSVEKTKYPENTEIYR